MLALATAAAVALPLALLASGTQQGIGRPASPARRVAADRAPPVRHRSAPPVRTGLPDAVVSVPADPGFVRVPPSFLGISTEYWAMPMFERHMALLERVLTLPRVQGAGCGFPRQAPPWSRYTSPPP